MATVFIVNHSISGPYAQSWQYFHKTEGEAAESFFECKQSVGEDPAMIQLIALDTETLDAVTHCEWSGNFEDLEEQDAALEADGFSGHVGVPDGYDHEDDEPLPRDGSGAI
jgi:hypothetical protein